MKYTRFFAIFLCACLLLTACGSGVATDERMESEMGYSESVVVGNRYDAAPGETMPAGELKSESPELSAPVQTDRKLIKTVKINAETEHYEELLTSLEDQILALGGYVESRQTGYRGRTNRSCSMTIRIPADNLGQFMTHVTEQANVLSSYENTQDVTTQYVDTQAKIAALQTEQARLLELLAQAGSLYDILEIEARLSEVTYELERYESMKRSYDNQVSYATIHLSIDEVKALTPMEEPSLWQRITDGFSRSLEGVGTNLVDAFVWFIVNLPYLAMWVPIVALGLWLIRKLRRKVQKRKQSPPSETP